MAQLGDVTLEAEGVVNFPGKGQPSLFVNQFYLVVGVGLTRITFGERVFSEAPAFTSSFTIPTDIAKEMAETILRIAAENEAAQEAASKEPKSE